MSSYLFTFQEIIQPAYYDIVAVGYQRLHLAHSGRWLPETPSGSLDWPPLEHNMYTGDCGMIGETAWHVVAVCVVAMCVWLVVCRSRCSTTCSVISALTLTAELTTPSSLLSLSVAQPTHVRVCFSLVTAVCSPAYSRQSTFLIGHCRL